MDWSSVLVSTLVGGVAGGLAGGLGHVLKLGKNGTVVLVTLASLASGFGYREYAKRSVSDFDRMMTAFAEEEPRTPMDRYLKYWALEARASPEIRQWFEQTPQLTAAERQHESMLKTRAGLTKLSDEDLVLRMRLLARMLGAAQQKDCASFGRGDLGEEGLGRLLGELDDEGLRAFGGVITRAVVAELRQTPSRTFVEDDLSRGFSQLGAKLGEQDARKLADYMLRVGTLSDEDACWTTRTLYQGGAELPAPYGAALAFALASN
ncbi:hypothetical protein ACN469_10850 [Corallococcus terminator]